MNKVLCSMALCVCVYTSWGADANTDSLAAFINTNTAAVKNESEESIDSVASKLKQLMEQPATKPRSFIMPAALIAGGTAVLINRETRMVNDFAKRTIYKDGCEDKLRNLDHAGMFVPALAVYGLNMAGIKGQHNLGDRTLIYTMSSVICNGLVFSTKRLTGQLRPDNSDKYSFPSGHTAQAFASAEFMRQEYRNVSPWYGAAGYACAIGVGVLRMYHNKHWFNDVLAGAGVGILSTRMSYWLYPKVKKALFPKSNSAAMIAPSYSNGTVGLSVSYSF